MSRLTSVPTTITNLITAIVMTSNPAYGYMALSNDSADESIESDPDLAPTNPDEDPPFSLFQPEQETATHDSADEWIESDPDPALTNFDEDRLISISQPEQETATYDSADELMEPERKTPQPPVDPSPEASIDTGTPTSHRRDRRSFLVSSDTKVTESERLHASHEVKEASSEREADNPAKVHPSAQRGTPGKKRPGSATKATSRKKGKFSWKVAGSGS